MSPHLRLLAGEGAGGRLSPPRRPGAGGEVRCPRAPGSMAPLRSCSAGRCPRHQKRALGHAGVSSRGAQCAQSVHTAARGGWAPGQTALNLGTGVHFLAHHSGDRSVGPMPPLKPAWAHGAHRGCGRVWGHAGTGRPLGVACRVCGVHPGGHLMPRPRPWVEAQAGLSPHVPPRTFNYILRELPKVPTHVPVCVLGNYRDMGEHRVILPDDVRDVLDHLDRWAHGCPQARPTPPPGRSCPPGSACCTAPAQALATPPAAGPGPSWRLTRAGSRLSTPSVRRGCRPRPWASMGGVHGEAVQGQMAPAAWSWCPPEGALPSRAT